MGPKYTGGQGYERKIGVLDQKIYDDQNVGSQKMTIIDSMFFILFKKTDLDTLILACLGVRCIGGGRGGGS